MIFVYVGQTKVPFFSKLLWPLEIKRLSCFKKLSFGHTVKKYQLVRRSSTFTVTLVKKGKKREHFNSFFYVNIFGMPIFFVCLFFCFLFFGGVKITHGSVIFAMRFSRYYLIIHKSKKGRKKRVNLLCHVYLCSVQEVFRNIRNNFCFQSKELDSFFTGTIKMYFFLELFKIIIWTYFFGYRQVIKCSFHIINVIEFSDLV